MTDKPTLSPSQQNTKLASLVDEMKNLNVLVGQINGDFDITRSEVPTDWKTASELIKQGKEIWGIGLAQKSINRFRGILTSFLKHSVIPKLAKPVAEGDEQMEPMVPRFVRDVDERQGRNYDTDIIERLRKKINDVGEIMLTNTSENGSFMAQLESRVVAYNDMKATIAEADKQQKARDAKRMKGDYNVNKGGEDSVVARRINMLVGERRQQEERRKIIDERRKLVAEAMDIF